jgi:hypothetical protein
VVAGRHQGRRRSRAAASGGRRSFLILVVPARRTTGDRLPVPNRRCAADLRSLIYLLRFPAVLPERVYELDLAPTPLPTTGPAAPRLLGARRLTVLLPVLAYRRFLAVAVGGVAAAATIGVARRHAL